MKLDKTTLDALTCSMAFQQWPAAQAVEQAQGGWAEIRNDILYFAAQQAVWEIHQRLALLFDLYAPHMTQAEVNFSVHSNIQGFNLSRSFNINGYWTGAGGAGILMGHKKRPSEIYPTFLPVDGGALLNETCDWINSLATQDSPQRDLHDQISLLQTAFNKPFKSVDDVLINMRTHAPLVDAWVRRYFLEHELSSPTTPPRSSKRSM